MLTLAEGAKLRALYYPYSWCLNENFLRRAILYFDEIVFLQASGPELPLRSGDEYYGLLGMHGRLLAGYWLKMRGIYETLLEAGVVQYIRIADVPALDSPWLSAAFYGDLSDDSFVAICEEDAPFGWLIPVERMPPSLLKLSPVKLSVIPPYGDLLEELHHRWYEVDEDNTFGGKGDSFWTRSVDGRKARRIPHAVGASLYLNQCLIVSTNFDFFPVTDSLQHHRLLLRKYRRALEGDHSRDTYAAQPSIIAAEIEKYVVAALDVMSVFLSEEDLRQRSIPELLSYKREGAADLARFRASIVKLASSIAVQPWDPKFQVELRHFIDRDLLPEVQRAADGLKGVYEKMFGKIIGSAAQKLLAASTLSLLTTLLPHLSLAQILTMGCASVLASLGWAAPDVASALKEASGQKRNSLSFIIGLSNRRRIENWLTVHQASGIVDLLALRRQFGDVQQFGHTPELVRRARERSMLGFTIPHRMDSRSFPFHLLPILRQIESDPYELEQTRNDAHSLLATLSEDKFLEH